MALLGFNKKMAPAVECDWKRQTIRRTRHDIYPGKRLQLYAGLRTRDCRKLMDPTCKGKRQIVIDEDEIILHGSILSKESMLDFVHADGFVTIDEFTRFFRDKYGLPFGTDGRGAEVIYW